MINETNGICRNMISKRRTELDSIIEAFNGVGRPDQFGVNAVEIDSDECTCSPRSGHLVDDETVRSHNSLRTGAGYDNCKTRIV